jgi:RNA polymerase sigma-70 factor (ECF subfamily)
MNQARRFGQPAAVDCSRPDGAIIAASRVDPSSFAPIFDRHFEAIHRYLGRRLGGAPADDLAAETFVVAFRSRDRYDCSHEDARPWLFGIATNLMRRHWRTERRQLRAYERSGVDPIRDEIADADRRLDAAAAGPALARALAAIAPEDREALLLFAWADLSYADIGAALGIPIGTVRSPLFRARGRLRELLAPGGQVVVTSVTEGGRNG